MLARGVPLNKTVHLKWRGLTGTSLQGALKFPRFDTRVKSEIDLRAWGTVSDVISLILGIALTEVPPGILRMWMALNREVPAVKSIEIIEADRKFEAEPLSE